MTAADLVAEMRRDADFAGLFEGAGSSGSGARGAGGTGGSSGSGAGVSSYSLSDWKSKMARAKPDERMELMRAKASGRITVRD